MSRSGRMPIYLALGASLGVIGAYLIAGGVSYKPLEAADPCDSRPLAVLGERGVLEGVVLSGLDGAACQLGVTREELTTALADDAALEAFAAQHRVSEDEIDDAVRAGLLRAVDDAEAEGLLGGTGAAIVRLIAENAPIAASLDAFRAIPGDPTLPELLQAVGELGLSLDQLQSRIEELGSQGLDELGPLLEGLLNTRPPDPSDLPDQLEDLLPGGAP